MASASHVSIGDTALGQAAEEIRSSDFAATIDGVQVIYAACFYIDNTSSKFTNDLTSGIRLAGTTMPMHPSMDHLLRSTCLY